MGYFSIVSLRTAGGGGGGGGAIPFETCLYIYITLKCKTVSIIAELYAETAPKLLGLSFKNYKSLLCEFCLILMRPALMI